MRITVLHGGLLTTVQDLGRPGPLHLGIPTSGALAKDDLAVLNRLLGNDPGAAGLEMIHAGPDLRAEGDVFFALWGTSEATIDGARPVAEGEVTWMGRRSLLHCGRMRRKQGVIAFAGGLSVAPVMGSRSTFLDGALGGLGRALRGGDLVLLGPPNRAAQDRVGKRVVIDEMIDAPLRVVPGPDDDTFSPEALSAFLAGTYTVGQTVDRMGARLQGARIPGRIPLVPSRPVVSGTLQVPPEGHPILMLADHQTTGGYGRIATVVSADMSRAGRLAPGERVGFSSVTVQEARQLRKAEDAHLDAMVRDALSSPTWRLHMDGRAFTVVVQEI